MIKEYGEDASVCYDGCHTYPYCDGFSPIFFIQKTVVETDEEYETRIKAKKDREQKREESERKEFERLSKKFAK